MQKLILLRHATAETKRTGQTDRQRRLTDTGLREAAEAGEWLRRAGLCPDVVLVSPAIRTQQTLKALMPWANEPTIHTVDELYLGSASAMARHIGLVELSDSPILIVGHNPGLQELAGVLAQRTGTSATRRAIEAQFPPASLAIYDLQSAWIAEPVARNQAHLVDFWMPSAL